MGGLGMLVTFVDRGLELKTMGDCLKKKKNRPQRLLSMTFSHPVSPPTTTTTCKVQKATREMHMTDATGTTVIWQKARLPKVPRIGDYCRVHLSSGKTMLWKRNRMVGKNLTETQMETFFLNALCHYFKQRGNLFTTTWLSY